MHPMSSWLLLLSWSVLAAVGTTSCPNTTATRETKPLYLLTLVPFPDPRHSAGWDGGLGTVPGARVARDEINNRTDLLPGYHIELIVENIEACSYTSAGTGLKNLVKYTVNPPCRPVAAIIGLLCSSHTAIVSPVAGRDGFSLVQLAVANAPIFQSQNNSFPHLWHFLGAGTVYADATLALMNRFNWTRIGIVYDHDSTYFLNVATYFQERILAENKTLIFSTGILDANFNDVIFQQIISSIRDEPTRVLFVALNDHLASELLCLLEREGLTYPHYIWIQVGKRLDLILREKVCEDNVILRAKQGHIQLQIASAPTSDSRSVSGEQYSSYVQKYFRELQQVQHDYITNGIIYPDLVYSNLLYDQVWAFALAMNYSLPVLENRNLSIDNYTIGQPEITAVIEEQMAKLNFQGFSGVIKFNDKHGVFATVDIYQVNGSDEQLVGSYVPQLDSEQVSYSLSLRIDNISVPDDEPPVRYVLVSLPVAACLYTAAGLTLLFITIVLILLLIYREWPEVKASSPYLSIFMIVGCYLLCFAVIFRTTYAWQELRSSYTYSVLVITDFLCVVSGLSVVIITLFFRLLRVFHIFSTMTMKARALWKSCSLALLILVLSSWPSVVLLIVFVTTPPGLGYDEQNVLNGSVLVKERTPFPIHHLPTLILLIVVSIYLLLFLVCILYFAIRMRKIDRSDFKDTKKVNLLIVILTVTPVVTGLTTVPLTLTHNHPVANIALMIGLLIISNSVTVILFLPKVIPAMFNKKGPRPKHPTLRRKSTVITWSSRTNSYIIKN